MSVWLHRHKYNQKPAYGHDVLSVSQLRYWIRKFRQEREYGVCHIRGGWGAFLRYVGYPLAFQVQQRLSPAAVPDAHYLSAKAQRAISRKVWAVLRGEVIFVELRGGPTSATFKPTLGHLQPPLPDSVPVYEHPMRVEWTPIGPKLRRLW